MNPLLIVLGVLLIVAGMTAGLWAPFPLSILIGFVLGFSGGWLIGEGSNPL